MSLYDDVGIPGLVKANKERIIDNYNRTLPKPISRMRRIDQNIRIAALTLLIKLLDRRR